MSRNRDNGLDQGLSPWSPISLSKLSPCRLREVDLNENEEGELVENQPIQETQLNDQVLVKLNEILQIQLDLKL